MKPKTLNEVIIIGQVACDCDSDFKKDSGQKEGNFALATDRSGESHKDAVDFHCIVMDFDGIDDADVIPFIKKGESVLVN